MSLGWREGMHKQVKEKMLGLLSVWEVPKLKNDAFRYLRYSQFYKICINKFGSRSNLLKQSKDQHEYLLTVTTQLQAIRKNLTGFMFNFTKQPSTSVMIPHHTQIPQPANSSQQFKIVLDQYIEKEIAQHLQGLQEIYNREKLLELKHRAEQLQTHSPQNEEAFQQDYAAYEELLVEAMNVNCIKQVLEEIQDTTNTILAFRNELAQKTAGIHGQEVLKNLYKFSLTHPETDYNSLQSK